MENIIIDKNQNIKYIFNEDKDININILIKEKIECNLDIFIDTNFTINFNITLENGATLNHNSILINTTNSNCTITQNKNSKYENMSLNFANNNNFTTNNSAHLNDAKACSNIKIIDIAKKSSNIESIGLISISENSTESVGHQSIIGILLDNNSSINAKPNLEIKNNDVTCSHGSSITQIDDEKLFYLNSKGFNKEQSVNLIVHGYFDAILSKMDKEFSKQIKEKLENKNII